MARIAIDCDGVLANFDAAYVAVAGLPTDFRPTGWYHIPDKHWRKIDATHNFWLTLPAYAEEVGSLAQWLSTRSGDDVWILTSRRDTAGLSAARQTELWLEACHLHGGNNYLGVITAPYSEDKVDIASKLDIDWIIDDKAETIESMDRYPFLHAALLDRPWNQDAHVKWRVKSLEEFLKAVR